ncbi:MAG: TetR family transcriptional regulator, partial [Mesorhizobium sp.]
MIKLSDAKTPRRATSPAELTRAALVRAALKLFGRQGFDGTSTREIAAEAGANIGSIAYHFGGKEGLRAAAADFIVETIQAVAGQALNEQAATAGDPEAARAQLF